MAIATHDSTDGQSLVLGDIENLPNCTIFRDTSGTAMIFNTPSGDAYKFGIGDTSYFTIGTTGIGYPSGSGGAVTQATNKGTGVTLNTPTGVITMNNASLAAAAEATFTVTNSTVAATDTVVASIASGDTAGQHIIGVTAVASGSFKLTLTNVTASTQTSAAVVVNFAVIKAVSS